MKPPLLSDPLPVHRPAPLAVVLRRPHKNFTSCQAFDRTPQANPILQAPLFISSAFSVPWSSLPSANLRTPPNSSIMRSSFPSFRLGRRWPHQPQASPSLEPIQSPRRRTSDHLQRLQQRHLQRLRQPPPPTSAVRPSSGLDHCTHNVFKSIIGMLSFNSSIINSMIICYCKLGKLVQARTLLGKLIKTGSWPSESAFGVFIRTLCAKDQFFEAYHMFIWMRRTGFDLNMSVYNLLVPGLCSIGQLDSARWVFNVMVNSGIRPTVHLYRSLVHWFCKKNRALEAERALGEMEDHGLFPDLFMYTIVIQRYCKEGKMESAFNLFNRIGKHRGCCKPDAFMYSTMVNGFLNQEQFDTALKLFTEMMERRFVPDRFLCHNIIMCYCRKRKVDYAVESLDMMVNYGFSPDLSCYVTVISTLRKENRFEDAERWLDKMLAGGVIPDYASFVSLIESHLNGMEHVIVEKVLQALAVKGFDIDISMFHKSDVTATFQRDPELLFEYILGNNVVPVNMALNLLIHASCLLKNADFALFFMGKLAAHGLETSIVTCKSLLKFLYEVGEIKYIDLALDHFQNLDCISNESTYSILIDLCPKRGDISSVLKIFKQMKEKGLWTSVARCDSLIGALCREKRLSEAEDIFQAMFQVGVKPDVVVYTTLLSGYSNMGRPVDTCSLFAKMKRDGIKPSLQAYSTVINVLTKKNMFRNACFYLDEMLREGFLPDTTLYTMLIHQFAKKGEIGFAFILYDLMIKDQIKPNLTTILLLISGTCRGLLYKGRSHPFLAEKLTEATCRTFLKLLQQKTSVKKLDQMVVSLRNVNEKIKEAFHKFLHVNGNTLLDKEKLIADMYYRLLISCKDHKMENACYVANQILTADVGHKHVTCTILINGYIRSGEIGMAVELFNSMNRNEVQPDLITYNTLVKGLCAAGRGNDALLFIHMMQKRGFLPDKILYEKLIECFCVSYSSDIAFKLLKEMLAHNHVPRCKIYNKLLWILTEDNKLLEARWISEMLLKHGRTLIKQ